MDIEALVKRECTYADGPADEDKEAVFTASEEKDGNL